MSKGDFELYVEEGPERGRFIPLGRRAVKIGRRTNVTIGGRVTDVITLDDPTMSNHHATLDWLSERGLYRLVHCSQTNHTLLNGRPIQDAFLTPNDTIKMGRVVLRFIQRQTISARVMRRRLSKGLWRLRPEDRVLFFYNLSVMLACGLTLVRGLEALMQQAEHPRWYGVLEALLKMVNNGAPLSMAMAAHTPPFTSKEMAMVRAGETSGTLPQVLRTVSDTLQRELELVRKVRSALTYPAVVLVCGIAAVLFMGQLAFSALVPMLQGSGVPLPFITQALIAVSGVLSNPMLVGTGVLAAVLAGMGLRRFLGTSAGEAWRDRTVLRVPLIGPLMVKVAVTRFCYSLSQFYRSGLPMLQSFQEAAQACGNSHLAVRFDTVSDQLKQGASVSQCLLETELVPWSTLSLVDAGEHTGKLDDMLMRAAHMMHDDVQNALDQTVKLLEPLTLAIMGFLVGCILLGAFLPIYAVVSHL